MGVNERVYVYVAVSDNIEYALFYILCISDCAS